MIRRVGLFFSQSPMLSARPTPDNAQGEANSLHAGFERVPLLALAILTGLLVWQNAPDVNEAHYLVKAKQFHDSSWCREDLFATSHQTHWLFYLTAGWPTRFLDLAAVAWSGRLIAWLITGWGMFRLSRALGWSSLEAVAFAPWIVIANLHLHLAGEWFAGGLEAKSFAWGFGFLAIASFLERRPMATLLFAALACGFHIVVGGWLCLSFVIAEMTVALGASRGNSRNSFFSLLSLRQNAWLILREAAAQVRKPDNRLLVVTSVGLILAGLVPALSMNWGVPRSVTSEAGTIQAFHRLAHHQDPLQFSATRWIAFATMLAIWRVVASLKLPDPTGGRRRLDNLAFAALAISSLGLLASIAATFFPAFRPLGGSILVLYLFRLADVIVPMAFVAHIVDWIRVLFLDRRMEQAALAALAVVIVFAGIHGFRNWRDPRSAAAIQASATGSESISLKREIELERNWIRLCRWIQAHSGPDDIFITPANQQTFKWYAGRAEVANWKDMPQDAVRVLEWNRRWNELYSLPGLNETGVLGHLDSEILAIARRTGAKFLIVEKRHVEWRNSIGYRPSFREVTTCGDDGNSTFALYVLD